jgi:polyribonucleotide nucleotidyltransferase
VIEVDQRTGKLKLSRKALLPKPEGMKEDNGRQPRRQGGRDDRNDRNDRRERRRD